MWNGLCICGFDILCYCCWVIYSFEITWLPKDAKRENVAINNEIKYRQTDDYIRDQARDTFGLRDEDETIFLPGETD